MSIHERLAAVAAELHLTGFGSEMTEAWKRATAFFAAEIHKIGGAPAAGDVNLSTLADAVIADLGGKLQAAVDGLKSELELIVADRVKASLADIDAHIAGRVDDLIAKAAAADAAKTPAPAEPAAAT